MSAGMRFVNNLHKLSYRLALTQKIGHQNRSAHISPLLKAREVIEKTEGNVTTIEGKIVDSPRKGKILDAPGPDNLCPLCRLDLDVKYTDVKIISQFVQEDGNIVPRQISGLCFPQHRQMIHLIHKAHSAGLMQHLRPHIFPEEYSHMSDHAWKKYNVYYTEIIEE
ncbi:mitochondrial translation [Mactra antiquata]